MRAADFAWTFPVYILAKDYSLDPITETIVFDEKLRFVAPEALPGGPQAIAIFTDSDLAENFRQKMVSGASMDLLPFRSPGALRAFLERASSYYFAVVVDLNRKTRRAQPFSVQDTISAMNELTGESGESLD